MNAKITLLLSLLLSSNLNGISEAANDHLCMLFWLTRQLPASGMVKQTCYLEDLPAEIRENIYVNLPRNDDNGRQSLANHANLRLTSRRWEKLAAKSMFRDLRFNYSCQSLLKLLQISLHPTFSTFVSRRRFDSASLWSSDERLFERIVLRALVTTKKPDGFYGITKSLWNAVPQQQGYQALVEKSWKRQQSAW